MYTKSYWKGGRDLLYFLLSSWLLLAKMKTIGMYAFIFIWLLNSVISASSFQLILANYIDNHVKNNFE